MGSNNHQHKLKELLEDIQADRTHRMHTKGYDELHKEAIIDNWRSKLPAERCDLMQLTDDDLLNVLAERKLAKIATCLKILNAKPVWRQTGEKIYLNDKYLWTDIVKADFSYRTIRIKLITQQIDRILLDKIFNFLTNENEVQCSA